jgi:hypothetical protein
MTATTKIKSRPPENMIEAVRGRMPEGTTEEQAIARIYAMSPEERVHEYAAWTLGDGLWGDIIIRQFKWRP